MLAQIVAEHFETINLCIYIFKSLPHGPIINIAFWVSTQIWYAVYANCPLIDVTLHISGDRLKVKNLLSHKSINSTDSYGRTPLMYAAIGKRSKVLVCVNL